MPDDRKTIKTGMQSQRSSGKEEPGVLDWTAARFGPGGGGGGGSGGSGGGRTHGQGDADSLLEPVRQMMETNLRLLDAILQRLREMQTEFEKRIQRLHNELRRTYRKSTEET